MRVIDLFCGAGGLSLGFAREGFTVARAVDIDPFAVETFNRNVANVAVCKDIGELDPSELPDTDGIIGGPPCQSFSIACRRMKKDPERENQPTKAYFSRDEVARNDPRSNLSVLFTRIISQKQPRWFAMENVDGLLNLFFRNSLEHLLREAGYSLMGPFILNAAKYGVPQFRKRLFFIGFRGSQGTISLPAGSPRLEWMTVRQALPNYEFEWYYRHPRTYGRRAVYSVDEPSPTIRTVNRPMPTTYKRHPGDAPYIGGQVRSLTSEERAILQSFPPDFSWPVCSKTEVEKLIGDAVPPRLARVIARAIRNAL